MNNVIDLQTYKDNLEKREVDELSEYVASIVNSLDLDEIEVAPYYDNFESLILPSIESKNDIIYALQTILFAMDRLQIDNQHIKPIESVVSAMFKEEGL